MMRFILVLLVAWLVGASAPPQVCSRSVLYLGTSLSNGLFVSERKKAAFYTKRVLEAETILTDLDQGGLPINVRDCSNSSVARCIEILIEEGRIVLAFQPGDEGHTFTAAKTVFKIRKVERKFGVGLGDMYWIEYRSLVDVRSRGHFSFSTESGVLSISVNGPQDEVAGPSLRLVQPAGLLAGKHCQ